jgi:hypothetical protein
MKKVVMLELLIFNLYCIPMTLPTLTSKHLRFYIYLVLYSLLKTLFYLFKDCKLLCTQEMQRHSPIIIAAQYVPFLFK